MDKCNDTPNADQITSTGSPSRHSDPQGPVPALRPPGGGRSPTRPSTAAVSEFLTKLKWTTRYRVDAFRRWFFRECRLARVVSFIRRDGVPVQFVCPYCLDYVRHVIDRDWSADVICCTACRLGFTPAQSRRWHALTRPSRQRSYVVDEPMLIAPSAIREVLGVSEPDYQETLS